MHAELFPKRREPALERTDHARSDTGRMPVHAHHSTERLEPEWMRQATQQLVAPVVMDDRLADHRAEPAHALAQPRRHAAAMQREVSASGAMYHGILALLGLVPISFFASEMSTCETLRRVLPALSMPWQIGAVI